MSQRRFLVRPEALAQAEVRLDAGETAHARKVLRLTPGEIVWLLDGQGQRARAELISLGKDGAVCRVLELERAEPLAPRLVLCPGLAKGPSMDFLAARLTELAVDEVRPFLARRSEARLKDAEARLERWQRLAGQALKQCGAPATPRFFAPVDLAELTSQAPAEATRIILYERERGLSLAQALAGRHQAGQVWVLVGPEGGFSGEEAAAAVAAGFVACGLPGVILRAETACLAVAAVARFGG